jgi:hypothetical protein
MSSNPPHRLVLDVDPDEGLTTSHLASSSLSADEVAAEVDAEPAYAHDDDDHQSASTAQPQAPSATTNVPSMHQTNNSPPPPLTVTGIGMMGIEAIDNGGQGSSLDVDVDDDDNPTSLHQSAAKCKNVGVDDADPMESSANSSDDVIVDPNRGETDHEDDARLDSSTQRAGEVEDEEAAQILAENFVSTATTTDTTGNNDAAFHTANARIDHEPQHLIIHDAFLVEMTDYDNDVIMATHIEPTLPFWKQKRMQLLLSGLLLFAVTNAIAIVNLYLGNDGNNEPSTAAAGSTPSNTDLSSLNFLTPEECADKIAANAQKVEIQLDDPRNPRITVDGSNMVMAVSDVGETTSSQVVIFYVLATTGTWQVVQSFRMENVGSGDASVALFGKTALVGFGGANNSAGDVLMFEQNQLGRWEQVNDPFIRTTVDESRYGFGMQVAIDGEFACVVEYNDCVYFGKPAWDSNVNVDRCNHNVNVFRRVGKRWVEFDVIAGEYCRIAGNILVVLEFDLFSDDTWNLQLYEVKETADGFVPFQDPIIVYDEAVLSMELSRNLFVYWDRFQQAGVIYQRQTESGPFSIVEQIFVIASSENQIAIHNDVLVVGGDNQTHIFSVHNGNWIEDFTLDH